MAIPAAQSPAGWFAAAELFAGGFFARAGFAGFRFAVPAFAAALWPRAAARGGGGRDKSDPRGAPNCVAPNCVAPKGEDGIDGADGVNGPDGNADVDGNPNGGGVSGWAVRARRADGGGDLACRVALGFAGFAGVRRVVAVLLAGAGAGAGVTCTAVGWWGSTRGSTGCALRTSGCTGGISG
jgi:hypothetical protein